MKALEAKVSLPKMDGTKVAQGIFLVGEPVPRPDLGENSMVCLANAYGMLVLIELKLKFKEVK